MRPGTRLGYHFQTGILLHTFVSVLCGMVALPALGLILLGAYVQGSLLLCLAVAVPSLMWWLLGRLAHRRGRRG
jgi:hypothetical protein